MQTITIPKKDKPDSRPAAPRAASFKTSVNHHMNGEITAPTDLHRPSDPQVSTERPSSFSFACKAVGPCTGMSADLQTRDGVHTRRPTPWHQVLRAASVARAARPAAWSFRRVDAKVGPAISPVMCAGTAYQTPSSVVSVGASESPRCAPLPHRCRAAAAEAKNGPSVRAFERG